jgi:hypothetical protein
MGAYHGLGLVLLIRVVGVMGVVSYTLSVTVSEWSVIQVTGVTNAAKTRCSDIA